MGVQVCLVSIWYRIGGYMKKTTLTKGDSNHLVLLIWRLLPLSTVQITI